MKKMFVGLAALAAPATFLVGTSSPAQAVQHDWVAHYGHGFSEQVIRYDRELGGKIRLVADRDNGDPLFCVDVRVDWDTVDPGHYDVRIVRQCATDARIATDSGGNGWWEESWNDLSDTNDIHTFDPSDNDWDESALGRTILGMEAAGVFLVTDGSVHTVEDQLIWQGGSRLTQKNNVTHNGGNARVRTMWQDGHVETTNYCTGNQQSAENDTNACIRNRLPAAQARALSGNEDLQAAEVRIAWENNGLYSECMAERGYDVPWQDAIGLAPALEGDPEAVAEYEQRQDNMVLERRVPAYAQEHADAPFNEAVGECRDLYPAQVSDTEYDALQTTQPSAKTLRIARNHGWNRSDPFAARANRR
jgi:hypothetical protein